MATLYAAKGGGGVSDLYTLDPGTGAETSVGPIGFSVTGLSYDPIGAVMYGLTPNQGSNPRSLISIDTSTGAGTLIGSTGKTIGTPMGDIANDPNDGALFGYGFTASAHSGASTINKLTGLATTLASEALSAQGNGCTITPDGTLYAFPKGGPELSFLFQVSNSGLSGVFGGVGVEQWAAKLAATGSGTVTTLDAVIYAGGGASDNLICDICADDAGGSAPGTVLGSATIPAPAVGPPFPASFIFSPGVAVTNATTYWFVWRRSASIPATGFYNLQGGGSAGAYYDGATWNLGTFSPALQVVGPPTSAFDADSTYYTIDKSTGVATLVGALSGGPSTNNLPIGAASSDSTGLVWALENDFGPTVYLITIDVSTGVINSIATLNGSNWNALAWGGPDVLTANFTGTPRSGFSPLTVAFTDHSIPGPGGPITSWLWNFGDSHTSTAQSPVHVYTTGGAFTVSLTVDNV